ncbi:hypothetical protein [Ferrovibrio sp.]|uniref:hypothetical protein n=1 Tax=Ferrovibrio sp. TaxID=1917215 RepID=UPI000CCB28CA|nr:hypothetical protein [Ferrovibrio sp.]PJI38104.1 MAG: hypothetical protein CTR53_17335 [Ferrovibrio sp.]
MRIAAAVLLSLAVFSSAWAQLPAVDPVNKYRLIGPADRSDSRCIGQATTPLCAVETLLACFARRDADLCHAVWSGGEGVSGFLAKLQSSRYWWSYRIAAAEQSNAGEAVIAVAGRMCGLQSAEPDCFTTPAPPTSYRLRQVDGRWQVVDWQSPPGQHPQPATR